MRAADVPVDSAEVCPSCPYLAHAPNAVALRLRTFLARWWSDLRVERRCSVAVPAYTHRRARRVFALLVLATLLVTAGQDPLRSTTAWLAGRLGWSGSGNASDGSPPCALMCPNLLPLGRGSSSGTVGHRAGLVGVVASPGGTGGSGAVDGPQGRTTTLLWAPRAHPVPYACLFSPPSPLPLPCPADEAQSYLLTMNPISFLRNYLNPCWYEPIAQSDKSSEAEASLIKYTPSGALAANFLTHPTAKTPQAGREASGPPADVAEQAEADGKASGTVAAVPEEVHPLVSGNTYGRNVFACFSPAAVGSFQDMATLGRSGSQSRSQERPARRLRCLPHFYIAGMPKSGSTDLFRKVVIHPDVVRPPLKESHWWTKNRFGHRINYTTSIPLSDYVDLFDKAASIIQSHPTSGSDGRDQIGASRNKKGSRTSFHHKVTVDASASTFWSNDEWWRLPENCGRREPLFTTAHYVRRLTPQARIIVILRNPTERLYSDYLFFTKVNKSLEAFHDWAVMSLDILNQCQTNQSLRACVYNRDVANLAKVRVRVGIYHIYLSEWMKLFPKEQLLVLRLEDYARDTLTTMRRVFRFLGLRPLTQAEEARLVDLPRANTRKKVDRQLGPMLNLTRQLLQQFYRPHNQVLARLLQDRRFLWDDYHVAVHEEMEEEEEKEEEEAAADPQVKETAVVDASGAEERVSWREAEGDSFWETGAGGSDLQQARLTDPSRTGLKGPTVAGSWAARRSDATTLDDALAELKVPRDGSVSDRLKALVSQALAKTDTDQASEGAAAQETGVFDDEKVDEKIADSDDEGTYVYDEDDGYDHTNPTEAQADTDNYDEDV